MADHEEILSQMRTSIQEGEKEAAAQAAEAALAAGISAHVALEKGFAEPIRDMGEAFNRMEIFLPQLVLAAEAMQAGMKVLEAELKAEGGSSTSKGVVVLGTVEGDIHDIGKTVVATMLRSSGYEVHDLGIDVAVPNFMNVAEKVNADIIGVSALLSTTMLRQRDLIELLNLKRVREKYFVIVGGAPVTAAWADEIGADAFGRDAHEAVTVLDSRPR